MRLIFSSEFRLFEFVWRGSSKVKKISMWIGISLGALLVIAFVALSVMAGGPKDALYMVRYALPHMHRGNLRQGDGAPDAKLFALNGTDTFHIRERAGAKPLVLVFGSFT
jgi:hypothetical protein